METRKQTVTAKKIVDATTLSTLPDANTVKQAMTVGEAVEFATAGATVFADMVAPLGDGVASFDEVYESIMQRLIHREMKVSKLSLDKQSGIPYDHY